jgi:3'-phosphoadenosine 5'-phosphosulfate (PAPS) 3'-phosphatase
MHLRHAACRSKLIIDSKADESPVTKADREAEAAMRRLLAERVPDHAIFGAKPHHLRCCCAHMMPSGHTCLLRTEKIWLKQTVGGS